MSLCKGQIKIGKKTVKKRTITRVAFFKDI